MEEAGAARKPSEGIGIDLTVHGGGPQESGRHQERCRGCDILGASDSEGLERVAYDGMQPKVLRKRDEVAGAEA